MAYRVPSHLYRNRHGTFYFRLGIPQALRSIAGTGEVRFSLETQDRQTAIISALPLIADLPRLAGCLQRMADTNETPPEDFLKLWQRQVLENAKLRMNLIIAKEELDAYRDQANKELDAYRDQVAGMVPRSKAQQVVKQAHTLGKLRGQEGAIARLEFPWARERTKLFSELAAAYLNHHNYRPKGGVKKPLSAKTLDGYTKDIDFFLKVMGDVHIGTIDSVMAGEYFNILRRLPANISRKPQYKDKTIPELLALNDPPQSEYNASKKMERPSGMFKWALREKRKWGIDLNPFEGFGQSGDNATARRPFKPDEMLALLKHPNFVDRRFENSYAYWLIPLAVFTGARLGELCQLDLKDFVIVEGIDCIDINDIEAAEDIDVEGRKKRVKTKNAKRLVPIHPELIRLGLLRYVETLRAKKQIRLFPELNRTRRDGPAHAASNWFQRFRARVGIVVKQEAVFHSFRHGFITTVINSGIAPHTLAPIVGHESELVTGKIYWNVKDATKRKPTVDAFVLHQAALALIPSIEDVSFVLRSKAKTAQKEGRRTSVVAKK